MKPSTIAIHVGNDSEPATGAVISPIYQTSTFAVTENGKQLYDYTRAGNPNFSRLEATLAALEGGKYATVLSSGLGAMTALLSTLRPGDHIIAGDDLYGGTIRLLKNIFESFHIDTTFVSFHNMAQWEDAIRAQTRLVLFESPTNPLLGIADIAAITQVARKRNLLSVVDNTFATPILQQPLELGADVVVHSTTKYIGGHSDVIGGVVVTNNRELHEKMIFARKAMGINPSPFDCWLTARGLKTLALRMKQHEENATFLAYKLQGHPAITEILYPGLTTHPEHLLASRQMSGFGGMLSLRVRASKDIAEKAFAQLKLFIRAESLGGVESLICHPATQTHVSLPENEKLRRGITKDLWRLSVGIEDGEDLFVDLKTALDTLGR